LTGIAAQPERGLGARGAFFALALALVRASPALAGDAATVNHTDAYVDESIAAAFMTTPNLCTEPVGTQGTSASACSAVGERAVAAATGASPYGDVYWEPIGSALEATNAFVPEQVQSPIGYSGYGPLFTQHKYDLFGRGDEYIGPYTREEHLFFMVIKPADGLTNGQTSPGDDMVQRYIRTLLLNTENATTFSLGGLTFQYADLPTYERITGFTSGKRTTVENNCLNHFPAAVCSGLSPEFKADLFLADNQILEAFPDACGSQSSQVLSNANCNARDQWVDQVVTGYVTAWEPLGGAAHFVQNFRDQLLFDHNDPTLGANTLISVDHRLEQSVELSGAFTSAGSDPGDAITPGDNQDFVAGRQTFQQAFQSLSDQATGTAGVTGQAVGQLVSQDVNGYFSTCANCDNPDQGVTHAFEPGFNLEFMPYQSGWNVVPTVTHAGI